MVVQKFNTGSSFHSFFKICFDTTSETDQSLAKILFKVANDAKIAFAVSLDSAETSEGFVIVETITSKDEDLIKTFIHMNEIGGITKTTAA